MTLAFRKGKAFICQNPACSKKFYKHGYASNSSYRHVSAGSEEALNEKLEHLEKARLLFVKILLVIRNFTSMATQVIAAIDT